ncbi:MAG: damage-control phosphatase ARMT1 family protein [Promethearchaeia archaeon]
MKVEVECVHCLIERAVNQAKLATDELEKQMEVVTAITKLFGEKLDENSVPSHIGTERDLLVQKITGNDPYQSLKEESNTLALELLPTLRRLVHEQTDSHSMFRKAALIAAAANAIEFDVSGRDFDLNVLRELVDDVESDLAIDEVDEFYRLCQDVDEVVYLMDNAGEIVLDMVLIEQIQDFGAKVVAVVKGGPILNDATMTDAEEVGLDECADRVVDTGAPAIGVNLERDSDDFKELLFSAELVVAKGMGNYESMTEFDTSELCPVVHILRTKCWPVARHVGVDRHKNVVMIRG